MGKLRGMDRSALLDRGAAQYRDGALDDAAASFSEILTAAPGDAEALSNLAGVLNAAERAEAAEAACRAALAARPGYWAALANLGTALHRQNRLEPAAQAYIAAVNANPGNAAAWTNLGVVLTAQGRLDGAKSAHAAALKLCPDDPEIRTNRAISLLAAGAYPEGFAEYEWRWRCPSAQPHGMTAPPWRGEPGQTVLLHAEGGFGDTLQFLRFAPLAAARAARVILRVPAVLAPLAARSFAGVAEVIDDGAAIPAHDLQCPFMSLPFVLGTRLQTVPAGVPYLLPQADAVAGWRQRLAWQFPARKRVGLVWAGAPRLGMAQARAMNARRSIPPALLAPLGGISGVQLISLQAPPGRDTAPPPPGLFDPMPAMRNFDDTAALVAALDLVITVDSAVAHLAGALGRPVWLTNRYDGCWRWLTGRQDSPWYPTLRIYRQAQPGEWAGVVAEIARDLAGWA